ncbi:DUF4399 domain-containing protein [Methylobacterium nodulans]|uniref:DUF4399 domain-containing protein n=1 Tax=Methylobacterium nodulans (strain LMG 21967 / CNCM I-2342 / ORS 2060) TaxID=460265 RepID=B8IIC6_METNO|nr:DUF4399 domain-containing protein [Methylobacterium nodulans]ACL57995.1 hypothetical protein Mnod_3054 [Methylobacterium nodulans ORS 2060]
MSMLRFAAALLPLLAAPALAEPDHPAAHAAAGAPGQASPAPPNAHLYFIAPANGARLRGPVLVQFGLRGMGVTQAGSTAAQAGHHHLLVDSREPVAPGEPIPADKQHLHFGAGQTETNLDLPPGRHRLQLVLGDARHKPFAPLVASRVIEVTVLPPARHRRVRRG